MFRTQLLLAVLCIAAAALTACSQTTARRGATPPILTEAARFDYMTPPPAPPPADILDTRRDLPPDTAIPVRKVTQAPGAPKPLLPRAEIASETAVSIQAPADTLADLALPVRKGQ